MTYKDRVQSLSKQTSREMVRPGAIFITLSPFTPKFPTPFLVREDGTKVGEATVKAMVAVRKFWEHGPRPSSLAGDNTQEMILPAKIRPFLILRVIPYEKINGLTHHVIGAPLSSVKTWMKQDQNRWREITSNQLTHIHYLDAPRNASARLDKESVVMVCMPCVLPLEFFNDYRGYVHPEDWLQIRAKTARFFNSGDSAGQADN